MATKGISVPIIDLANFEAEKEKFMAAVSGPGCFRVANHGIPEAIIADMKASVGSMFELPSEVKSRNTHVICTSGYVKLNSLNPFYEALGIYDVTSPADVHAFCSNLDLSTHDREIVSAYTSLLHGLIVDLASKIAEGLGIMNCSFQKWPCHLRMNKNNFTKETIVGSSGVPVHTDCSFITVLHEDMSNEGFEMMDSTGNFVAVDPVLGTFLVNMGDIAKVWSNGRVHNVTHRVLCKKVEPRITLALFMHAPKDNKVEPQVELIDYEHPQLYRSFDYMEYRKLRNSNLLLKGEVLLNWAINEDTIMA